MRWENLKPNNYSRTRYKLSLNVAKVSQKLKVIGHYRWILVLHLTDFKVNPCFLVAYHGSHNRLVAGSSPAGATKF